MTTLVTSDRVFSSDQRQCLLTLSDMMIPERGPMPSAAEADIFARTEISLAEHSEVVTGAVNELEALARQRDHQSFANLDNESRQAIVTSLKATNPTFISILQTCVVASYYQDDRVLRGLGLPARAPFPIGNPVDATDWSLLDPVRERSPFYRVVDGEGG